MLRREDLISLSQLQDCLGKTIAQVNDTREPVYVLRHGRPVAAIVDLDEYRELVRLAEKGLMAELAAEVEDEESRGPLASWDELHARLKLRTEQWKREEHG